MKWIVARERELIKLRQALRYTRGRAIIREIVVPFADRRGGQQPGHSGYIKILGRVSPGKERRIQRGQRTSANPNIGLQPGRHECVTGSLGERSRRGEGGAGRGIGSPPPRGFMRNIIPPINNSYGRRWRSGEEEEEEGAARVAEEQRRSHYPPPHPPPLHLSRS